MLSFHSENCFLSMLHSRASCGDWMSPKCRDSNYSRLIQGWFGVGLREYDFYILPLGFAYPFETMSVADLEKEPSDIAAIIREVSRAQEQGSDSDGQFFLVCEINTTLVSAKKITEETDLVVAVDGDTGSPVLVSKKVKLTDQYPYTWTQVLERLKAERAGVNQNAFNSFIRENKEVAPEI